MKNLVWCFLVLLLTISCSNEKTENDLSKENLFGKVKSVETTTFYAVDSLGTIVKDGISTRIPTILNTYNEFGNLETTKKFILENPNRYNEKVYYYNNLNKLVEEKFYLPNDSLSNEVFYKYDDNDNLIEWITNNDDKRFNLKYILKYDSQNNLIEELVYADSTYIYRGKEVYKYHNKTKKMFRYNPKGVLRKEIIYDKNKKIIEEIEYDSLKNVTAKWTYNYDNKGNKIEENWFKTDTILDFKIVFKYDKYNNPIEKIRFSNKNIASSGDIYEYEYDKKGNWIKKTHFQSLHSAHNKLFYFPKFPPKSEFIPIVIIERKIEYYK